MKKNLLIALFVIFSQYSWGQSINLINKTVSDKNSKTLYIGVENEFIISNENPITVQPQMGVTIDHNKIIIRPTSIGQLTIVFIANNGKIPINFNVTRMPNPLPVIGGQDSRQISKDVLLTDNSISLKTTEGNSFFMNYGITSFTLTFKDKSYDIKGNKFSTEILSEFNSAKIGDTFSIASLVFINNDINKTLNLNSKYAYSIK